MDQTRAKGGHGSKQGQAYFSFGVHVFFLSCSKKMGSGWADKDLIFVSMESMLLFY